MSNEKISLKDLIRLQDIGKIFETEPTSWDVFSNKIPESLLDAWKEFLVAKKNLNNEIMAARQTLKRG